MKIWTQEERCLPHSVNGNEQQARIPAEQFFQSPGARAATAAAQPTYLRQLAAEAAGLRKKLAEAYPELARVQRLHA